MDSDGRDLEGRAADRDERGARGTSDADRAASDADQTASDSDRAIADRDQQASDRDQVAADRHQATAHDLTPADITAYGASRDERETTTQERYGNRLLRASTARDRDRTATRRDRTGEERDDLGRARDERAIEAASHAPALDEVLVKRLQELSAQAEADRRQAAADRTRAAVDRANAARERARLESELSRAHLDELTGAYRRQMGRLALTHEIERARRGDGRFVLAFVDVDGLKAVNDGEGHAAGDRVLQIVVREMRTRLRSFDPIMRYGGDEFVCGLGGTSLADAEHRFESIAVAVEAEAGVGISVGFAALGEGESADLLTERADAAMLVMKGRHHAERPRDHVRIGDDR